MGRDRLEFLALPDARTHLPRTLPATQSRMRKEFKRGMPSSFCPFRTFRTSEKYLMLFCYFSDKRKVHDAFLLLSGQAKSTPYLFLLFKKITAAKMRLYSSCSLIFPPAQACAYRMPVPLRARACQARFFQSCELPLSSFRRDCKP